MKFIYLGGSNKTFLNRFNVVYYYFIEASHVKCFEITGRLKRKTKKLHVELYGSYISRDRSEEFLLDELIMKPLLKEI